MRDFTLRFDPAGTFPLQGPGWPSMAGTWAADGDGVTLQQPAPAGCTGPGRYMFTVDEGRLSFALVADSCPPRRLILDRSRWLPQGITDPAPARNIVRTAGPATAALPPPTL
jgi:hypothetical protein